MDNTPINQLTSFEATARLQDMVKQAYYRRDRKVPANLNDIVATLKADIFRAMPTVGILTIDQAVFDAANEPKLPLSPALFFSCIRNRFTPPRGQRDMDIDPYVRPDTEGDTISLLDTLAVQIAKGKKAFFKWPREYGYLVLRGELSEEAWKSHESAAKSKINTERVTDMKRPISDWDANQRTLEDTAKALAVIDWLRSCLAMQTLPSKVLAPKMDEASYQLYRKKSL